MNHRQQWEDMEPIALLVADGRQQFCQDLEATAKRYNELRVANCASAEEELLQFCAGLHPDVVLIDEYFGTDQHTPDIIEALRQLRPQVKIIVVTDAVDRQRIETVLQAGVNGYLLRAGILNDFLRIVRAVMSGKEIFSPEIIKALR